MFEFIGKWMKQKWVLKHRTRKALKKSILKWERIVAGTQCDGGSRDCALCHLFNKTGDAQCEGCPVKTATGHTACRGTPYVDYRYAVDKRIVAKRMLDFLKGLKV